MEEAIEIDGSLFEGGGQMIRSSIALSVILKKEFRMHSIRKNRPNPGINNQLRSVLSAFSEKVPKVGETELYFYPKFLFPKEIKASTASSCTLVMQCMVPICLGLRFDEQIKVHGGTDVNKSPPTQSLERGLVPLLEKMNIRLVIKDIKAGFFPSGKGYVSFEVKKCQSIGAIRLVKESVPCQVVITYYVKDGKVPGSSKELRKEIQRVVSQSYGENLNLKFDIKAKKVFNTKDEYGIGCLLLGDQLLWDIGTVGQKVHHDILIQRLLFYTNHRCALDQHHQDQLLLYMALANGQSQLLIGQQLSLHTQSLLYVINKFIPGLEWNHSDGILSILGINYQFSQ